MRLLRGLNVLNADLPSSAVKPVVHVVMSTVTNGANNTAITGTDFYRSRLRIPQ